MHVYNGAYLYGTKLIGTRTEPLWNKQVFIEHYYPKRCYFYIKIIIYIININSPFSIKSDGLIDCIKCSSIRTCD